MNIENIQKITAGKINPRAEAYVNNSKKWKKELTALRMIINTKGLVEEIKWGA